MGVHNSKEWLYSAIEAENTELINKILYKNPTWVNEPMTKDCCTTPLSRAVWRGATRCIEELLKLGADVNYAGPTGITPLMWAAKRGRLEILMLLIEKKAQIQTLSPEGFNCFDWAIIHGQYQSAQYLMTNYKFKFQNIEKYQSYQSEHSLPYMNYEIIMENLQNCNDAMIVPNYHQKPKKEEIVYTDPVIDPNEYKLQFFTQQFQRTWKQYLNRVMNFEEPPLVERSALPLKQQPQNRILGKLNSYWNGKSPYPKKSNSLKNEKELPMSAKQELEQKKNQEADSLIYEIEL